MLLSWDTTGTAGTKLPLPVQHIQHPFSLHVTPTLPPHCQQKVTTKKSSHVSKYSMLKTTGTLRPEVGFWGFFILANISKILVVQNFPRSCTDRRVKGSPGLIQERGGRGSLCLVPSLYGFTRQMSACHSCNYQN